MLKTAKVRPLSGTSNEEVLSQVLSQFAYLIDEVGHLFEVYDGKIKALESRITTLESAGTETASETAAATTAAETAEAVSVMSFAEDAAVTAAESYEENTETM